MATKINLGRVSLVPAGSWEADKAYKRLDLVYNAEKGSFIAKQDVPAGTELTNTAYWQASTDSSLLNKLMVRAENAETARQTAETQRASAETARQTAETARAKAETARATAEQARAKAETSRQSAEDARATAEQERAEQQAKNNADQAANNAAAQGLMVTIVAEGGYDPTTLEPTGTGEVGKLYLVPDPHATGDNVYAEWMWVNSKWERVGSSNATVAALTTEQVDEVASGGSVTSDGVVNGSVLTYLWAKLKGAFAALSHAHDAADVATGTLSADRLPVVPVAKGGTGSATAAAALTALGAASATDLATVRDSVGKLKVWTPVKYFGAGYYDGYKAPFIEVSVNDVRYDLQMTETGINFVKDGKMVWTIKA